MPHPLPVCSLPPSVPSLISPSLSHQCLAAELPGVEAVVFGHIGDGNLHYNVFPPAGEPKADWVHLKPDVMRMIHDLVDAYDGSISAEHGIGRLKAADLQRYGDPAKLAVMRGIKQAIDPLGIMNPGAVISV